MDCPSFPASVPVINSLRQAFNDSAALRITSEKNIYTCGDEANFVYFVETGLIKLLRTSPEGKECILAVLTTGDVFGELCLSGKSERLETATAVVETIIRKIPCEKLLVELNTNSLFADFICYLVQRIAERENTITNLMTLDSQRRLVTVLAQLAGKLGQPTPKGICIEHRITHEELSEMVGTTRPRITAFLREFRRLGLIETTPRHFLVVRPDRLSAYLQTTRLLPRVLR